MTEIQNYRFTELQNYRQGKSSIAPTFSKRGYNDTMIIHTFLEAGNVLKLLTIFLYEDRESIYISPFMRKSALRN